MRFEVMTTTGGSSAAIVASSGTVTVKSEHLQEERLELVVRPVELVHQEHGLRAGPDRPQQWPLDEELGPVQLGDALAGADLALLEGARVEELARVVPLVERLRGVDALVALEPDQVGVEDARERLADLRLADAGLALEEQRAAHGRGQEDGRREPAVEQVRLGPEGLLDFGDGSEWHG